MILIWRGWGLLAVVALFPLLASCGGLITVEPKWIFAIVASVSLLLAGAVCIFFGSRWNRDRTDHSFYFIPLQVWGWVYLIILGLQLLVTAVVSIIQVIKPLPGPPDPNRTNPVYFAAAASFGLIVVVATAWTLILSARQESADEAHGDNDAAEEFDSER